MDKRRIFRWIMIILPSIAILFELFAVHDGNPDTEPWTWLITQYIPADLFYLVFGGLVFWAFAHFIKHYKK